MLGRFVLTVVLFVAYAAFSAIYSPGSVLMTSKIAGKQFEDSDASFVSVSYALSLFRGFGLLTTIALVVLLLVIWWKPGKKLLQDAAKNLTASLIALIAIGALVVIGQPRSALAFAETSDKAEYMGIDADETAFMIPNFGKTGEDQAQYRTEGYLNRPDVKVPGKFIQIPHSKLSGTGGSSGLMSVFGADYYVSTATLAKVKRSPFSRSWVQKGRGTNPNLDESFACQTPGGHNVMKIGISIGAKIKDEDAARYFANFGYKPLVGDMSDIKVIFTSVRFARDLNEVMDNVVHMKTQEILCSEIGKYVDPVKASAAMDTIMVNLRNRLREYLKEIGITLSFVGWADTWTFDEDVQFAINQVFTADLIKDKLDVLERNAYINFLEGMGAGSKTKGPPSLLSMPGSGLPFSVPGGTMSRPVPPTAPSK